MRLLFVHADRDYAIEYGVHQRLIDEANNLDVESFVIRQSGRGAAGAQAECALDFGRDYSGIPQSRTRRMRDMAAHLPAALRHSLAVGRQFAPDAVYTSQRGLDLRVGTVLSSRLRVPHVIHVHYNIGPWLGRSARRTIVRSTHLITVSEFLRSSALLNGVDGDKVHTVHNSINVPDSNPEVDRALWRARFGLAPDALIVLAAGRIDPGKGHPILIKAFARVVERVPTAALLICGKATTDLRYAAEQQRLVESLALQGNVVFAGHVDDLRELMEAADIFCLPSQLEPFGLVYIEAMAAALPVVAHHSGAVPEIVLHGSTGLLSLPGDESLLALQLVELLTNRGKRMQMGVAGRRRALHNFSPLRLAERWRTVLDTMVEEKA